MFGPFIHRIDPIIASVGGFHVWWYGLSYALGFSQMHLFIRRRREALGLSLREVYSLTLMFSVGVLIGGRAVEVLFDEWGFYSQHPWLIPALWLGGMATHGLLIGAAAGTWLFARLYRTSFVALADALVVPGAFLMGMGRIGNFIDGQIVGSPTDVWWAVLFPYAAGFRHPVVLYDGLKNLVLGAWLARVHRRQTLPGTTAIYFVFWYAFPRIFIDLFRDYPTHRLALGTGQTLNLIMAALGAVLLVWNARRRTRGAAPSSSGPVRTGAMATAHSAAPLVAQRMALAAVLLFCLTVPSNWTQDVPAHYAARHADLHHSWFYPALDTAPAAKPPVEVSDAQAEQ